MIGSAHIFLESTFSLDMLFHSTCVCVFERGQTADQLKNVARFIICHEKNNKSSMSLKISTKLSFELLKPFENHSN